MMIDPVQIVEDDAKDNSVDANGLAKLGVVSPTGFGADEEDHEQDHERQPADDHRGDGETVGAGDRTKEGGDTDYRRSEAQPGEYGD